jgi:hypothetical protein
MASSRCRDEEREISGMTRVMGRVQMIGPYGMLAKCLPKIGTGKGAVMDGNGQTLWVNDERNVG